MQTGGRDRHITGQGMDRRLTLEWTRLFLRKKAEMKGRRGGRGRWGVAATGPWRVAEREGAWGGGGQLPWPGGWALRVRQLPGRGSRLCMTGRAESVSSLHVSWQFSCKWKLELISFIFFSGVWFFESKRMCRSGAKWVPVIFGLCCKSQRLDHSWPLSLTFLLA